AEGDAVDGGVMSLKFREALLAGGHIPHAQRAAGVRGLDHRLAVVGKGERTPVPEATSTSETDLAFLNIPNLDSALFSPRQQRLAVGGEDQSFRSLLRLEAAYLLAACDFR